ncbi:MULTISPECIES: hypothetical protein [unclassified Schlesneria]|uniref:hypothetical protein n=1 Tax=Schlesneria TaxID=656899 RepID=UPI002EDD22BE
MRNLISTTCLLALTTGFFVGCSETSTVKDETKIQTPGGTTTITTEKEVEKTGDHKGTDAVPVTPTTP